MNYQKTTLLLLLFFWPNVKTMHYLSQSYETVCRTYSGFNTKEQTLQMIGAGDKNNESTKTEEEKSRDDIYKAFQSGMLTTSNMEVGINMKNESGQKITKQLAKRLTYCLQYMPHYTQTIIENEKDSIWKYDLVEALEKLEQIYFFNYEQLSRTMQIAYGSFILQLLEKIPTKKDEFLHKLIEKEAEQNAFLIKLTKNSLEAQTIFFPEEIKLYYQENDIQNEFVLITENPDKKLEILNQTFNTSQPIQIQTNTVTKNSDDE